MHHHISESELVTKRATKHRFRHSIFEAWDRLCGYCGEPATTLDHVKPKVKGGLTVRSNLIPACRGCNCRKGHADMLDWFRQQHFWRADQEQRVVEWIQEGPRLLGGEAEAA